MCGDVRMAADVTNTLEEALQHEGRMSSEDAKRYVNEMKVSADWTQIVKSCFLSIQLFLSLSFTKENMRFHEDIFGINVTTTVSTTHS